MVTTDGGAAAAPFLAGDASAVALSILGAGVAVLREDGSLINADERFLALHALEPAGVPPHGAPSGSWPSRLLDQASLLSASDKARLAKAWAKVGGETAPQLHKSSALVHLEGGRILEIGASRAGDRGLVLVIREAADAELRFGRALHDVNNATSAILAHLHLALLDIEPEHPARVWLESVNASAAALREQVRLLTDGRGSDRQGGPAAGS